MMRARRRTPKVVQFTYVVDERFLSQAVDTLERLREESELRGHPMLASLLAIAKGEAEDDMKTGAVISYVKGRAAERDDGGAALIARKLACPSAKPAA